MPSTVRSRRLKHSAADAAAAAAAAGAGRNNTRRITRRYDNCNVAPYVYVRVRLVRPTERLSAIVE